MGLFILDEQLAAAELLAPLRKKLKVGRLPELRPGEHIFDDRVPEILRTLKQPTFITIDEDFWDRRLCHPNYAIFYFALPDHQQEQLPSLLFRLLRIPEFRSTAERAGKVLRVAKAQISYWQFPGNVQQQVSWPISRHKRR